MKKILVVILSIIAMLSFSIGLVACNDNKNGDNQNEEQNQEQGENESETDFFVLDSDGNAVATSDTTWKLDEEVNAVKILGDGYTLSGKSKYPIFVESEEVAFMTFKDLKIVSDKGFGFSVWNTNGLIITLEGDNDITVNGYSEYLKTEKEIYGNIGIDMGADLTFVGDGNLNITCSKVRADDEIKKAFNCGIYSTTGNADLSIATSGKISIVIERAEGTTTTNVLQTGILSDLSVFRMVSGEVDIDIKSSVTSHAEVNVYGVFGILSFDGGKISINVEKRSAYESGEALALYITNNQSTAQFAVENAESIETDIGYKFAQKTAGEKVVVSFSSEENSVTDGHRRLPVIVPPVLPGSNSVADGETPSDRGIVVPGPFRIVPVRDELRIKLDPPAIIGMQEDGETVSNIVKAIKEKLCYVAIDPEENGENSTDPKSPLWALLYRDGTNCHVVIMLGGGSVIVSTDGETPSDVSQRVIIKPIKRSSVNDSTDGVDGETPTDELVVNLGGSQMRVRIFTPIIPSKNGETADVSGCHFFKVALKKIEGNEDGVTDGEIVTMPEVQTIIFVVVGAEKNADGETPTDVTRSIIISQLKTGDDPSGVALNSSAIIVIAPVILKGNGETPTDAGARIILYPITLPRDSTDGEWFAIVIPPSGFPDSVEADGEWFAIVIPPSGFPDSVEADGEGAISIIGGGEGGEEQGEAGIKEVIYIGIIERVESAVSVPAQRAVIMSIEDLRPVTMEYVLADGSSTDKGGVPFQPIPRLMVFNGECYALVWNDDGVENGSSVIMINGLALEYVGGHLYGVAATPTLVEPKWKESDGEAVDAIIGWSASANIIDGSAGRFYRVIVTDSDSEVTGGVDGEGEQWTVSNEGGTIIIVVPQGVIVGLSDLANGEIYVPWRTYTDDQDALHFYHLEIRTENYGEGAISIIGGEGEETQSEDEKVQVFIKTRIATTIALQNLSKVTSNDGIKIPTIRPPTKVDDATWGVYLLELIVPQSGFPDGVEADDECEPEEVPTFMESRVVIVFGARNITKVAVDSIVIKPIRPPIPSHQSIDGENDGEEAPITHGLQIGFVNFVNDGSYEIWMLDIKGAVPFRLPLLKEGDPSQADGEENAKFGGDVTIIIMSDGASTNWEKPAMRYVLLVGETPTKTDGEEGENTTAVDFSGSTIVITPIIPRRAR